MSTPATEPLSPTLMAAPSASTTGHAPGSSTAPAQDWEQTTLRLKKADLTLFQALGDTGRQKPCLILYSGEHSGTRFALQSKRLSLGRSPECDVCLESPGVSRRHAEVREEGKHVVLHDLDSSNGTHLNEVRITQPQPLRDGDLVRLGASVLKFYESHSLDALLHERIDPESRQVGDREREIDLEVFLVGLPLLVVHDVVDHAVHVLVLQRRQVDPAYVAMHPDHGRQARGQVEVGGLVLDHECEQFGYVHYTFPTVEFDTTLQTLRCIHGAWMRRGLTRQV